MSETRPQPYKVREYMLDPGEAIPWHRHQLGAGQAARVTPPTVHHVSNPGKGPCRVLLIQGVGKYDFVKAD